MTMNCEYCGHELSPEQESAKLAEIENNRRTEEKRRLFEKAVKDWPKYYPFNRGWASGPRRFKWFSVFGFVGLVLFGGGLVSLTFMDEYSIKSIWVVVISGLAIIADVLFADWANMREQSKYKCAKTKFRVDLPDEFEILFGEDCDDPV